MQKGPFGYRVVDVGVTLVDGSFHAVDSSDMAFKSATRTAIIEGLAKAEPVLLEPIDHVTVSAPNTFTAAAQRLLTGRRGQIDRLWLQNVLAANAKRLAIKMRATLRIIYC